MSGLLSPSGLARTSSFLPDATNAGWREDEPIAPTPEAQLRQVQFDAAIEANRASTPQAVVDQRNVPRYSLRELNSLDDDAIAQRIKALDPGDNRPGWVKALDLIDMPRNALANAATGTFLPEARRRAIERGEFDQSGLPKVYGADMLRAMGVENRVVNAVGGFLVDVVTDPLSWIGGPLGGLKTAGTAGTVQISKQGQKALNTGLKAYRQGRPVADDAVRGMIESTIAAGKAAGELDEAADIAKAGEYAAQVLRGTQGRVGRGFERVGLGGSTRGGALANDTFRSRRAAETAEEAARIDAVKAFTGRYTNNRGIDLTKGRGGAEVAHIPFTDVTLTVPEFRIPGLGLTPGKAAVIQRAVAMASEGDWQGGTAIVAAQRGYEEARGIAQETERLLAERSSLNARLMSRREQDAPQVARLTQDLTRLDEQIAESQRLMEQAVARDASTTLRPATQNAQPQAPQGRLTVEADPEVPPVSLDNLLPDDQFAALQSARERAAQTMDASPEAAAAFREVDTRFWEQVQLRRIRDEQQAAIDRPTLGLTPADRPPPGPIRRVVDVPEGTDVLDPEAAFSGPVRTIPRDPPTTVSETGQIGLFPGQLPEAAPDQIGLATTRLDELRAERARVAGAIDELTGPNLFTARLDELSGEITALTARLDGWREGMNARLQVVRDGKIANALNAPKTLDDLMLAAELQRKAFAEARRAQAAIKWQDAENLVARATPSDIPKAQRLKRRIAEEVRILAQMDPEESVDEVLSAGRQDEALRRFINQRAELAGVRMQRLIDLSDDDLDLAEQVADAFQTAFDAASEVASLSARPVHLALDPDQRLLFDAARQILGINTREIGSLPFAAFGRAAESMGQLDAAASIADLGTRTARNFGGLGGIMPRVWSAYRRSIDMAEAQAADVAMQMRKGFGEFDGLRGLDEIARMHNARTHYTDLDALIQLRLDNTMRAASGMPSPVMATHPGSAAHTLMNRLREAGILQNAELMADIDRLAERASEIYRRIGEDAVRRGDFDHPIAPYAPLQLTSAAAARLKALDARGPSGPTTNIVNDLMDTAQARKTNIVEFIDDNGDARWFLVLEREAFGSLTDEALSQMSGPEVARMQEVRDSVQAFLAKHGGDGVDADTIVQEASRPLLPFEANELSARGIFDTMVGGKILDQGAIWETSAMNLLSRRVRAEIVAEAQASWKEAIEPFILTRFDMKQADALRPGEHTLRTGQTIKNLGNRRFEVGGTIYRPVSSAGTEPESLFIPEMVYGPDLSEALIPEQLAVAMERMRDTLTPKNIGPILGVVDRITSIWKLNTLTHLSWPISNAVGNTTLLAMRHPELLTTKSAKFVRHFRDATKIIAQRNTGGTLNREMQTVSIGGSFMPVADVTRMADSGGVMTQGLAGDTQRQLMRNASGRRPVGDAIPGEGITGAFGDRMARAKAEYAAARGDLPPSQLASRTDQFRAAGKALTKGPLTKAMQAWFGVNGAIDDAFRLALFMHLIDEGADAGSAAIEVQRTLLNFGDMTSLERNVIRPLIPFYAWTRASLPNMLVRAMTDPKQIAAVPKVAQAFEELTAGEGRVPRWKRPRWIQETMAIQIGSDPETASTLQIGTLVPQEAAVSVAAGVLGLTGLGDFDGRDFLDGMGWTLGQFGPVAKAPFELGTGRESFTGRSIGAGEGDGDVTLQQYLAGQIRWLRETGVGAPGDGPLQRAFERGPVQGVGRVLIGGRFAQNIDTESRQAALRSELKDAESELRKAISRADRRGDNDAGVELRTKLVSIYYNHLRRGGDPQDVPRWAKNDLEALGVDDLPPVTP